MLNVRQLEAFRATIISGSVTAAAQMLFVSQPSISRLLGDLESDLGFKLFQRHKGGMLPTEEAKLFYEEVEKTFSGLAALEKSAQEIRSLSLGRVVVASVPALAFDLVPAAIDRFHRGRGRLGMTLTVRSSHQILASVSAQKVDLGLVIEPDEYPGVEYLHRVTMNCVCVVPQDHSLASRSSICLADLQQEQLVLPDKDFLAICELSREQIRQITQNSTLECHVFFSSCALVARNLGVAIVDPYTASFFSGKVAVVPIEDSLPYSLSLVRPSAAHPSLAVQRFTEDLIEMIEQFPGQF